MNYPDPATRAGLWPDHTISAAWDGIARNISVDISGRGRSWHHTPNRGSRTSRSSALKPRRAEGYNAWIDTQRTRRQKVSALPPEICRSLQGRRHAYPIPFAGLK